MNPAEWAQFEVLGNTLLTWALGAGVFFVVSALLFLIRSWLRRHLRKLATADRMLGLDIAEKAISQTKGWFVLIVSLFCGSRFWAIPETVDSVTRKIALIAVLLQLGIWASSALIRFLQARRKQEIAENPDAVAAMDVLSLVTRIAIWGVLFLVILDNLGVNITTLVAGLGVGGIAVALAAQSVLGDLFASLAIVLDKPFVVGDFLIVDDYLGNVEQVGIKTTRLRSLSGEQLVFHNADLLNSRIRNYGRMFERRIVFSLGVTYQTPAEKLKRIPAIIREVVESEDGVRFDRAHFQKYGDFALTFEVVYYVLSSDYLRYMNAQQAINLRIFERFEDEGISFAYPTQTLYMNQSA